MYSVYTCQGMICVVKNVGISPGEPCLHCTHSLNCVTQVSVYPLKFAGMPSKLCWYFPLEFRDEFISPHLLQVLYRTLCVYLQIES